MHQEGHRLDFVCRISPCLPGFLSGFSRFSPASIDYRPTSNHYLSTERESGCIPLQLYTKSRLQFRPLNSLVSIPWVCINSEILFSSVLFILAALFFFNHVFFCCRPSLPVALCKHLRCPLTHWVLQWRRKAECLSLVGQDSCVSRSLQNLYSLFLRTKAPSCLHQRPSSCSSALSHPFRHLTDLLGQIKIESSPALWKRSTACVFPRSHL